jgi:serine/threonine-protein kinase
MLPTLPKAALSPTQHEHLTQLLLQWVGPIAPLLVQQALAQAEQATDLLQSLVAYVPAHYQAQFQHHLQALVQTELPLEPAVPPLPTQLTPPGSVPPPAAHLPLALNPDLAHRCEQELTAVIGPIAPLLVQEAIASATSLEQFVDCLAAHIPQPQVAARFKAHLLNLQS